MNVFLNTIFNGIIAGSWLAATAVGFVVLWKSTKVFNFAQSYFMLLGTYLFATLDAKYAWPLALIAAAGITVIIAVLCHWLFMRNLVGASLFIPVIATFGIGTLLEGAVGLFWGPDDRQVSVPLYNIHYRVGDVHISGAQLSGLCITAVWIVVVILFLRKSKVGLQMRATAENHSLAGLAGMPVRSILVLAWAIAGASAAIAGITYTQQQGIESFDLANVGLLAFPAIIMGGLESVEGAVLGGLAIGLVDAFVITYWDPNAQFAAGYLVLFLFLLLKPQGLFGERVYDRV